MINASSSLSAINLEGIELSSSSVFPGLFNFSSSVSVIDLSFKKLQGTIPDAITNMPSLSYLSLCANQFEGDSLTRLVFLSLPSNEFLGSIPPTLCHLAHIQVSEFSLNKISGAIPKCINNFTATIQNVDSEEFGRLRFIYRETTLMVVCLLVFLNWINLGCWIYRTITCRAEFHNLRTIDASVFKGNPGLRVLPLTKTYPGDEIAQDPKITGNANAMKNPEKADKLIGEGFYISIAIGFIFGFWGVCGSLLEDCIFQVVE
ncbi:unnamed protein product [Fraxinus pennsylvanica]|uniref:Uncharacterized protein n=1 Tax=Fraxinus pennsylvanica TaxID=56036 RepID=A0AAD1ZE11_9LAMI|nr:unnamed protein product [Fraxinus pennsylvanica]